MGEGRELPPFPSDRPPPAGDPAPDLPAVLADLWDRLEEAAARARPAFHLPTLSTTGPGGPAGRVVVLRHADRAAGALGCHTDVRSPKAAAVRADPRTAWTFYDRAAGLQVRASGPAGLVLAGEDWEAAWAGTTPSARRCYLAPHAPGTPTDGPDPNVPPAFRTRDPTDAQSAPGRATFALLRCRVETLDWLALHHAGHRRARFRRSGDGWAGEWVAV